MSNLVSIMLNGLASKHSQTVKTMTRKIFLNLSLMSQKPFLDYAVVWFEISAFILISFSDTPILSN